LANPPWMTTSSLPLPAARMIAFIITSLYSCCFSPGHASQDIRSCLHNRGRLQVVAITATSCQPFDRFQFFVNTYVRHELPKT
jgi:hypothetical protein